MKLSNRTNNPQTNLESNLILIGVNGSWLAEARIMQKDSSHKSPFVTNGPALAQTSDAEKSQKTQSSSVIVVTGNPVDDRKKKATRKFSTELNRIGSEGKRVRDMKGNVLVSILRIAMVAMVSISVAVGQGTPQLNIEIVDQKVNLTVAEKQDADAINYRPGDTLRYTIVASNVGDGLMTSPEIIDPIPTGVTYVAQSALGDLADVSFSINQGSTYMAWPPTYTVRNTKGILIKRKATPDMISHIKWNILQDMQPGDASTLEFLVSVN